MPESFAQCRTKGGKIKTIKGPNKDYGLLEGQYLHVCILDGKEYLGEKKQKKELARKLNV